MAKKSDLLSTIADEERIEILRRNWMSHEARWQMAVFEALGWEKGNQLNHTIIREMGKVMMHRLMNALGNLEVKNVEELDAVCSAAMDLYYPPPTFVYHFERVSEKSLLGVIEKCAILENVKKAGVADFYECGCFALRSRWYEALNMEAEEQLGKCLKRGDKTCEIVLKVNKWRRDNPPTQI
jgi:hypothetical protein